MMEKKIIIILLIRLSVRCNTSRKFVSLYYYYYYVQLVYDKIITIVIEHDFVLSEFHGYFID